MHDTSWVRPSITSIQHTPTCIITQTTHCCDFELNDWHVHLRFLIIFLSYVCFSKIILLDNALLTNRFDVYPNKKVLYVDVEPKGQTCNFGIIEMLSSS